MERGVYDYYYGFVEETVERANWNQFRVSDEKSALPIFGMRHFINDITPYFV